MNATPFFVLVQQVVWCGLTALALLFLFIAYRLREDKVFSLLGMSLMILCAMVGLDIWILFPGQFEQAFSETAMDITNDGFNIFACAYVLVTLWFTRTLTGRPGKGVLRIHSAVLTALAAGFLINSVGPAKVFMEFHRGAWLTTGAFDWFYMPYLIAAFVFAIYLTVRGFLAAEGDLRRTLRLIIFAYAILLLGGLSEFFAVFVPHLIDNVSGVTLGILAMGVMGTFIFTDRLVLLYEGHRQSVLKIAEVHGAMEAQRPLGDLGRSAAHISEEIRGYVATLKSEAHSLYHHPVAGYRAEVLRIENARRKLEAYTSGILDFSKSAHIGVASLVDLAALVEECLRTRFPEAQDRILVKGRAGAEVRGNPAKLIRAVAELLRNSLEAQAARIEIRLRAGDGLVCVAIEDNGHGIDSSLRGKIAQPFFTTRKGLGACGLGASIAEGIIKAHGGTLSFHPKSASRGNGMLAILILPIADRHPVHGAAGLGRTPFSNRECLLVSDNGAHVAEFLAICGKVGLRPLVLGSQDSWKDRWEFNAVVFVIVDSESGHEGGIDANPPRSRNFYRLESGNLVSPPRGRGLPGTGIYCEETFLAILSELRSSDSRR